MITLQSLTRLADGTYYAKWFDADDNCPDLGHTVAALHAADGRPEAANLGLRVPKLTTDQMNEARPDQHKAYELAALGTAAQPEWGSRYQKAAEIVESNGVRLTSTETAVVVSTSGTTYTIHGKGCTCKWSQFNSEPCSHYLATRMARALNQVTEPTTEAEKEAACEARRQANRDAMDKRIADRGENLYFKQRRQARQDGDGARQWARMAYANGCGTVPAHIFNRATGKS